MLFYAIFALKFRLILTKDFHCLDSIIWENEIPHSRSFLWLFIDINISILKSKIHKNHVKMRWKYQRENMKMSIKFSLDSRLNRAPLHDGKLVSNNALIYHKQLQLQYNIVSVCSWNENESCSTRSGLDLTYFDYGTGVTLPINYEIFVQIVTN